MTPSSERRVGTAYSAACRLEQIAHVTCWPNLEQRFLVALFLLCVHLSRVAGPTQMATLQKEIGSPGRLVLRPRKTSSESDGRQAPSGPHPAKIAVPRKTSCT